MDIDSDSILFTLACLDETQILHVLLALSLIFFSYVVGVQALFKAMSSDLQLCSKSALSAHASSNSLMHGTLWSVACMMPAPGPEFGFMAAAFGVSGAMIALYAMLRILMKISFDKEAPRDMCICIVILCLYAMMIATAAIFNHYLTYNVSMLFNKNCSYPLLVLFDETSILSFISVQQFAAFWLPLSFTMSIIIGSGYIVFAILREFNDESDKSKQGSSEAAIINGTADEKAWLADEIQR